MGPADVPQGRVVVEDVPFDPTRVRLEVALNERVAYVVGVHAQEILQVAVVEDAGVLVADEVGAEALVRLQSFSVCFLDLRTGEPDGRYLEQRLPFPHDVGVGVCGIFRWRLYQVFSALGILSKSTHGVLPGFAFGTVRNCVIPTVIPFGAVRNSVVPVAIRHHISMYEICTLAV